MIFGENLSILKIIKIVAVSGILTIFELFSVQTKSGFGIYSKNRVKMCVLIIFGDRKNCRRSVTGGTVSGNHGHRQNVVGKVAEVDFRSFA